MKDLFERLRSRINTHTGIVFMGIGEEKLSDDGVGPFIISELLAFSNDTFLFINAGTDPMARMEEVLKFKPSHLILIDTCTLNEDPGTITILEREDIKDLVPISSHTVPIHIVIDLIRDKIPNVDVFMIGIVPKSLEGFTELRQYKQGELSLDDLNENIDFPFFEINLTPEIQEVAHQIIEIIKKLILKL